METRVIGLAGRPGCGKSAVARALAKKPGVEAIDLDRVAWETYALETPTHDRLVERFGRGILSDEGLIDRERLGRLTLSDAAARRDLDAIVHPAVSERLSELVLDAKRRGVGVLLVEGALLASSPHVDRSIFDRILWLEASEGTRRDRLRSEGREDQADRLDGVGSGTATVVDAEGTLSEVAERVWQSLAG
jgi:dephospho-CoA kinase